MLKWVNIGSATVRISLLIIRFLKISGVDFKANVQIYSVGASQFSGSDVHVLIALRVLQAFILYAAVQPHLGCRKQD